MVKASPFLAFSVNDRGEVTTDCTDYTDPKQRVPAAPVARRHLPTLGFQVTDKKRTQPTYQSHLQIYVRNSGRGHSREKPASVMCFHHALYSDGESSESMRNLFFLSSLYHGAEGLFQDPEKTIHHLGLVPEETLEALYPFKVGNDNTAGVAKYIRDSLRPWPQPGSIAVKNCA